MLNSTKLGFSEMAIFGTGGRGIREGFGLRLNSRVNLAGCPEARGDSIGDPSSLGDCSPESGSFSVSASSEYFFSPRVNVVPILR